MGAYQTWFDEVFLRQAPRVARSAGYLLNDRTAGEDLAQEVFVVLVSRGERMMEHPNIDGWLYTTMKNLVMNELDRACRQREVLMGDDEYAGEDDPYGLFSDCLPRGLTEDEVTILTLYFDEGRSYEEISAILGKGVLACRTRLHRAKRHCRKLMETEKKRQKSKNFCNVSSGKANKGIGGEQDALDS